MKKVILGVFFLLTQIGFAQRDLTIEEATIGAYRDFAPESVNFIQWKNDNSFTHIDDMYRNLMIRTQTDDYKPNVLLSLTELQEALQKKDADFPVAQVYFFPYQYEWINEHVVRLPIQTQENNYEVFYDFDLKEVQQIFTYPKDGTEALMSDNHKYLAYLQDNAIQLLDDNGKTVQVVKEDDGIVSGSGYTHREEFGITQGMWFSPQSDKLMYYRKDETMVADYPLIDFGQRIAEDKPIKYPMAGMKSEEVTLQIYDISSQKFVQLQTGEPKEQFLTMVTWHPNGQSVFVGVLNREQNHLKINQYDAQTGAFVKTLIEETSDKYVEPQYPLYFNPNNDKQFVYFTEKDGYRQPYLYDTNGKLLRKLGHQDVVVKNIIGIDNNQLWYVGTENRALDDALYAVNLKNGKKEKVNPNQGTHEFVLNPSKTYFVDQYSTIEKPNVLEVVQVKNHKATQLLSAKNPYEGKIDLPKMELLEITADDNETVLNGRIIYPKDFDATKKYPVLVYVYGGPHAQLVANSWLGGASLFDYYMAQQGFVVFTLDNRGSANRGRDFEQVIHRQLGQNEMKDQMKGIAYLKSLPFVDADRIGVSGWSFGGFMTTSLMLNQPETFKVGVAGGPVIDWKWYEVMYGERYMDTPQENPEGYELTSTLNKVDQLQGRLLIIHGAQDPVVVQQHSMEFIEACIKARKQVDYFLYPTHEHNVMGMDRIHLNAKIADYFMTHLK
ncbi:MAG TPA: DPP IV N-terminal domain-containing protein [Flavobacterium sp.]|nr:DPP IV N-terminal domain-containing protein [Flavobacterium sp.]